MADQVMNDSLLQGYSDNERQFIVAYLYPQIKETIREFVNQANQSGQIPPSSFKNDNLERGK